MDCHVISQTWCLSSAASEKEEQRGAGNDFPPACLWSVFVSWFEAAPPTCFNRKGIKSARRQNKRQSPQRKMMWKKPLNVWFAFKSTAFLLTWLFSTQGRKNVSVPYSSFLPEYNCFFFLQSNISISNETTSEECPQSKDFRVSRLWFTVQFAAPLLYPGPKNKTKKNLLLHWKNMENGAIRQKLYKSTIYVLNICLMTDVKHVCGKLQLRQTFKYRWEKKGAQLSSAPLRVDFSVSLRSLK